MVKYPYIVIEGNIGVGKTSLVKLLTEEYSAHSFFEEFSENPFLPKFYENPEKHAFPLELSFLAERYHQLKKELNTHNIFHNTIIADYYFVKSLIFAQINLPEDEFKLYKNLFNIILQKLPKPNLFVYLYADVNSLQNNIKGRARSYETNISANYLEKINKGYLNYLNQQKDFPAVIIDVTNLDFVHQKSDYNKILAYLNKTYTKGVCRINS